VPVLVKIHMRGPTSLRAAAEVVNRRGVAYGAEQKVPCETQSAVSWPGEASSLTARASPGPTRSRTKLRVVDRLTDVILAVPAAGGGSAIGGL
jgi:hypothetical protein